MEYVRRPTAATAARWPSGYDALFTAFMRRHNLVAVGPSLPGRYRSRRPIAPHLTEVRVNEYKPWVVVEADCDGRQVVTTLSDAEFAHRFDPRQDTGLARQVAIEGARQALELTDADWIDAMTAHRDEAGEWGHPAEQEEWARIRDLVAQADTIYACTYDPQRPDRPPRKQPTVKVTDNVATVLRLFLDAEDGTQLSQIDISARTGLFGDAVRSALSTLLHGRWCKATPPGPDHPTRYRLTPRGRTAGTERLAKRARRQPQAADSSAGPTADAGRSTATGRNGR